MPPPPAPFSLSGSWLIRPDPDSRGVTEGWFRSLDGWDPDRTMRIPGAWQHALGADYHGVAWFAYRGSVPRPWNRPPGHRLRLRFDSVATDATVYVNGVEVGRHVGDFAPFEFDITDAVAAAGDSDDNLVVVVRVDEIYAGRPPAGEITERGHITKGFHDVVSLQHGGIWGDVTLRMTGKRCVIPDGIRVIPDAANRRVLLRVELSNEGGGEDLAFSIRDLQGDPIAMGAESGIGPGRVWEREIRIGARGEVELWNPGSDAPERVNLSMVAPSREETASMEAPASIREWSPEAPHLYELTLDLVSGSKQNQLVESHTVRFGFRTASTGGPGNRHILLNGRPLLIRGVLHWGHEPEHIAPAPTPAQVRDEFARLKAMGFNCVCLCMWYPPRHFFDIADEMGMLIWQEHPVWKSPMEEEHLPEYRRMFEAFFRRDRNHPSVVIVSGSCEHERIHPELAAWWWRRAKEELPDRVVQVQTAFIAWVNPEQVDVHDEHVYESSGRWVKFCEDVQATLEELPPKPFLMGETIIGTSWLDTAAVRAAIGPAGGASKPWWTPKGLEACEAFERAVEERYGAATLARFRGEADRLNLEQRKFQAEVLRTVPRHAGWVMNQIRDIPQARLGFMDDLGRWRFTPQQLRPWLDGAIVLLRTPDHRRGFTGGRAVEADIGISNYSGAAVEGPVEVALGDRAAGSVAVRAEPGEIAWGRASLALPAVAAPTRVRVAATTAGVTPNTWDLWVFPPTGDVPDGVVRLEGLPYARKDLEPEFEERCYSSGWGLKCRTWKPSLPHPESVIFKAPLWRFDAPMAPGVRVVVTHKLTRGLVDFMTRGGRVLLLANRTPGGLGTRFLTLWGQVPLVIEAPPLAAGDAAWVADLLHHDLMRRNARAIPVEEMGLAERVEPIVRLVFTHDRGVPRLFDAAFAARVGDGLLLATSLDHMDDPGRFLMQRFLEWLVDDAATVDRALDPDLVRGWAVM